MKRKPPPQPSLPRVEELLCFSVYAAGHAFNRLYKPLLAPLGLTYPQYLTMVALWDDDGATVGQLGARLGLESSTLTPLLKRLESTGMVRRERDPADERQVRILLTARGIELRLRATALPSFVLTASGLDEADMRSMRDRLTLMREDLAVAAADLGKP